MVGTYRVFLDDATGRLSDTHPLRPHFAGKNTLRYLDGWPSHFHGSAPAAFFRRARIEELGLRFDPEVRPNFEDGHFCVRYLLAEDRPAVGFVKTAIYQYRKRSDASSTLQTSMSNPDRYTKAVRNGYLAVLRESLAGRERPPEWLQNYIVYELSWYFTTQDAHAATGGSASGEVAEEFHALMGEICPLLDEHVVMSFRLRQLRPSLRYILIHGYATGAPWREDAGLGGSRRHPGAAWPGSATTTPGPPPRSGSSAVGQWWSRQQPSTVHSPTTSAHCCTSASFGCPRGAPYVSTSTTCPYGYTPRYPRSRGTVCRPAPSARSWPPIVRGISCRRSAELSRRDQALLRLAASAPVRRRFADAWVLMDRVHDADDSAEVLFRYLRKSRPKINAWFVIESGTPDWERLARGGLQADRGPRVHAVEAVDAERPAPDLLPCRRAGDGSAGDRTTRRPDLAVHLPAARRDQGRPVRVAQSARPSTPS